MIAAHVAIIVEKKNKVASLVFDVHSRKSFTGGHVCRL